MQKYFKHKIENLIQITEIVTIHQMDFEKKFKFRGERHNFWEFVFVEKGEVFIECDNGKFALKNGEGYFHYPNEFHSIRTHNESEPTVFIITFDGKSQAFDFFKSKKFILSKNEKMLIGTIIKEAQATFVLHKFNPDLKKLDLAKNPILGGQQMIRTTLEQLLILLMRKNEKGQFLTESELCSEIVAQIIIFMKQNITNRISIDAICTKFNYGKTTISTIFKQEMGISILKYFNIMKIERAKELLCENKLNCSQISDLLGFDCVAYFSNVFKKHVGKTPKNYLNDFKR